MKNILKQMCRSALKSFLSTFNLFILLLYNILCHIIYILNRIHAFLPNSNIIANRNKKETFLHSVSCIILLALFNREQILKTWLWYFFRVFVPALTKKMYQQQQHWEEPQKSSIEQHKFVWLSHFSLISISINCVCASTVKQLCWSRDILH
jgi:hypothetical protein